MKSPAMGIVVTCNLLVMKGREYFKERVERRAALSHCSILWSRGSLKRILPEEFLFEDPIMGCE